MTHRLAILSTFALLTCASMAADKPAPPAQTVFLISGLECGSCVYMVQYALSQTSGVKEAEVMQTSDNFAKVSFDPKVVSEHQLAQAVRDAPALHGTPYLATMKLRVSGLARDGNAAKVKALFNRWKQWVEMEVWDEREGEIVLRFQPLEPDAKGVLPRGWSPALLSEALQAPAPKGLGLKFEIVEPGPL